MRLLLDACVPRKLKDALTPHTTSTARERGWNRLPDGPLLDAMAGEIDVLITVDRGVPFQQRLHDRPFAVVVLRANTNRLEDLLPPVPALLQVLGEVKPGEVREIKGQSRAHTSCNRALTQLWMSPR